MCINERVDEAKNDTKKPPASKQTTSAEPSGLTRRRAKELLARLQERPELLTQVEALIDLITGESSSGAKPSADEVEARVVQVTRKLGRQTIEHWAHQAQERAVRECHAEHPDAKLKKKAP